MTPFQHCVFHLQGDRVCLIQKKDTTSVRLTMVDLQWDDWVGLSTHHDSKNIHQTFKGVSRKQGHSEKRLRHGVIPPAKVYAMTFLTRM